MDLRRRHLSLTFRGCTLDGSIEPGHFPHPLMAAELADELLEVHAVYDFSDGTIYNYRKALLGLLESLPSSLPKTTSLATGGRILATTLHEWERSLAASYPASSQVPSRHPGFIRRLIKNRVARQLPVDARIHQWSESPSLHPLPRPRPLDEHSNSERISIRDGCRQQVRELETRLAVGLALLERGVDPRNAGWVSPANLLWATRHLARPGSPGIVSQVGSAASQLPAADRAILDLDPDATMPGLAVLNRLVSMLYPTDVELIAFRSLLQLDTGAAPEELTCLTLDDLEWHDDHASVRLAKARARRHRTVRLLLTSEESSHGWRGGDLIRRILDVTASARAEAESTNDPLATRLFLTVRRSPGGALSVRAGAVDSRTYSMLIKSLPVTISTPHDPRRLRKTVKSVRAAVLRSVEMAAGDDHTVPVFQRHYAQSTTVHVLAGAAINAAQRQVFDRMQEGPTFVARSASEVAQHGDGCSTAVVSAARSELRLSGVDKRINVAQCADPYASPFDEPGRLCEHRPAACFACPNAIVFPDHLPRLLAYRTVLEGHEREMPPAVFAATHGQQLANLDRILVEFSDSERAAAQSELCGIDTTVHIPLSQRGTHL